MLQVAHVCQIKYLFEKNKHLLWARQITCVYFKIVASAGEFQREISCFSPGSLRGRGWLCQVTDNSFTRKIGGGFAFKMSPV